MNVSVALVTQREPALHFSAAACSSSTAPVSRPQAVPPEAGAGAKPPLSHSSVLAWTPATSDGRGLGGYSISLKLLCSQPKHAMLV